MGEAAEHQNRARRGALIWMSQYPNGAMIDFVEKGREFEAMCAAHVCLDLAKEGLCKHTVVSPTLARFDLLPAGARLLQLESMATEALQFLAERGGAAAQAKGEG